MERDNKQELDIAILQNNYSNMSEKIDKLEKTVVKGFEDIKTELVCIKDSSDKKYASKLTEKIVYGMVALIVVGALTAMLTIIYK